MEFFEKLGKKASDTYKMTTAKAGKLAEEAKLRHKISEDKNKINDLYIEIGKKVYEKHIRKENIDINVELEDECTKIDVFSGEIERLLKDILELKDRRKCSRCSSEIDKDVKFCPYCGAEQESDVKEATIVLKESVGDSAQGEVLNRELNNEEKLSFIENNNEASNEVNTQKPQSNQNGQNPESAQSQNEQNSESVQNQNEQTENTQAENSSTNVKQVVATEAVDELAREMGNSPVDDENDESN